MNQRLDYLKKKLKEKALQTAEEIQKKMADNKNAYEPLVATAANYINSVSDKISNAYETFMKDIKEQYEAQINSRQGANLMIINELTKFIEKNPDIRFNQMLYIMGIIRDDVDTFNVESTTTLKTIKAYKEESRNREEMRKTTNNKKSKKSKKSNNNKSNSKA